MAKLVIMVGISGSGKSTTIRNNGWEKHCLCPDTIRVALFGYEKDESGKDHICQSENSYVWQVVYEALTKRLAKGKNTVLDATNCQTQYLEKIIKIGVTAKAEIYIVDTMLECDFRTALKRNAERDLLLFVPDEVIRRQFISYNLLECPKDIDLHYYSPSESRHISLD